MLPNLSALVAPHSVAIDATKYRDPFGEPRPLAPSALPKTYDVPHDGSCLYHSLAALLNASTWHPMHGVIRTGTEMRDALATYFESNAKRYDDDDYRNTVKIQLDANNPERVSYDDAVPAYAASIRNPRVWGGDLELNIASELLGVIVHKFQAERGRAIDEALLHVSFFPDDERSDRERTVTKWVVVWVNDHFVYVLPRRPLGLQDDPPPPAETSDDVRARAEFLKERRARSDRRPAPSKNRLLAELARERETRLKELEEERQPVCYPPTRLTQEQRDQQASVELARRLEAEERQIADDAALARRLSYASLRSHM
jgi:hypothetical protein